MKRVCVFCGSSPGRRPTFGHAAAALGEALAKRGLGLVYGGGRVGLMGIVADATLAAGGEVIGVIPEALATKELAHDKLTKLHVVPTMHARKALMADLSDGFIALPGGFGTLEEFFEALTWAQLGFHPKPCGILNVDAFFDPLLFLLDHSVTEGFVSAKHREMIVEETDANRLLDLLATHKVPKVRKWIE